MKVIANLKLIGISALLTVGLSACDKPGPVESAGKKIDLTANEADKKMGEATNKIVVAVDDAEITTKVKAAIFAEPGLKTLQISVDTVKGVVTLSGSVDSQSHSDRVKALTRAVAGVRDVENRLVLKPAN